MPPILIDTNVLLYLYDQNAIAKNERAGLILARLQYLGTGRLSAQNLAEFVNAAMRKLDPPLTAAQGYEQVTLFSSAWTIFDLTSQIVLEAARGVRDYKLAYYDAQIWATARLNQVPVIFSEDFQDGQVMEGVRFVDPFKDGFIIEEWA
ncbi:MAG: PIN domain-containing protein [Chloroflexi bacterium]|nr:PIN domain-containing protein [Chloroflexota bacterium]